MAPSERVGSGDASPPVGLADVEAARERIDDVVTRTPVDTSRTFAAWSGADAVGLKLENMQRTGSFKIRGAYNRMSRLSEAERERGVVTSSAGNHAQGVALAGRLLGVETTVVVPEVTPAVKIEATRSYGAEVVVEGDIYEDAYQYALDLADEEGLTFVHPFDDADVVAGQGTIGLELREQFPDLDAVLVAVGGGGLVGGVGAALKAHDPDVRVIGVQPEGAAHAAASLEGEGIHELDDVDTVAEGIADTRVLETTYETLNAYVDDVVAVPDADVTTALAALAERAKVVAESAGATPVAALLSGHVDVDGERVAAVVSGGNASLTEHADLVRSGLMRLDRYVEARVAVRDWPAGLGTLADVAERAGAELDEVERARPIPADHPNRQPVTVGLAGSGREHLRDVLDAVDDADGLSVVDE